MSETPIWRPSPTTSDERQVDVLSTAADYRKGESVALIEDFGYACYPCAINSKTGRLERGGAYSDRIEARLWAERVAGLHPSLEGDERPAFYY